MTKQLFKEASTVDVPKGLPFIPEDLQPKVALVNRKPILPSQEELEANNRSHSAKLRVAKKTQEVTMEIRNVRLVNRAIRNHIRFMTRMEKAFYSAIVLTAIVMSISVVYLQGCNQAIKNQITDLNRKISDEKTELNNAKQAVNELTNSDRIKEIATRAGLSN